MHGGIGGNDINTNDSQRDYRTMAQTLDIIKAENWTNLFCTRVWPPVNSNPELFHETNIESIYGIPIKKTYSKWKMHIHLKCNSNARYMVLWSHSPHSCILYFIFFISLACTMAVLHRRKFPIQLPQNGKQTECKLRNSHSHIWAQQPYSNSH